MKRVTVVLFVLASLMLSFSLWNGGLTMPTRDPAQATVTVSAFGSYQRLILVAEGIAGQGALVCVKVNERVVATFSQGSVSLLVRDQDIIQIDSALTSSVRVTVEQTTPEITLPRAGDFVCVQNTVETLGRVIIRRRNG